MFWFAKCSEFYPQFSFNYKNFQAANCKLEFIKKGNCKGFRDKLFILYSQRK